MAARPTRVPPRGAWRSPPAGTHFAPLRGNLCRNGLSERGQSRRLPSFGRTCAALRAPLWCGPCAKQRHIHLVHSMFGASGARAPIRLCAGSGRRVTAEIAGPSRRWPGCMRGTGAGGSACRRSGRGPTGTPSQTRVCTVAGAGKALRQRIHGALCDSVASERQHNSA